MRKKLLLLPIFLVFGGFFSTGCTTAQRQALMDNLDKIAEKVQEKIEERERKELDSLNVKLAMFPRQDPLTGSTKILTWKDFDKGGKGHLDASEQADVGVFITSGLAKKVANGEISAAEAGQIAKSVGGSLLVLLAAELSRRGIRRLANGNGAKKPPSSS